MAEEQIERAAERKMDSLDRQLMRGSLAQSEYDREVRALDQWTKQQYAAFCPAR